MPTNVSVAAFVFGIVFVLAALVGKDIEVIAIKIPALGRIARIILGIAGFALIYIGLFDPFNRTALSISSTATETPNATLAETIITTTNTLAEKSAAPTSTEIPTLTPTSVPSPSPTSLPTDTPTSKPTDIPPTVNATDTPMPNPTIAPTTVPTVILSSIEEHISFNQGEVSVRRSVNLAPGLFARYKLYILEGQTAIITASSNATITATNSSGFILAMATDRLELPIQISDYHYFVITGSGTIDIEIYIPPPTG